MKRKIILLGMSDEILVYLIKYFKLNNSEIYLVLSKDEETPLLNEIEKDVVVVKIDNNLNQIKVLLKSVDPDIIYNFYGSCTESNNEIENLVENIYLRTILFLEVLAHFNRIKFVNLINRDIKFNDKTLLEIYKVIESLIIEKSEYYKNYYSTNVITKYRSGDINADFEGILEI